MMFVDEDIINEHLLTLLFRFFFSFSFYLFLHLHATEKKNHFVYLCNVFCTKHSLLVFSILNLSWRELKHSYSRISSVNIKWCCVFYTFFKAKKKYIYVVMTSTIITRSKDLIKVNPEDEHIHHTHICKTIAVVWSSKQHILE